MNRSLTELGYACRSTLCGKGEVWGKEVPAGDEYHTVELVFTHTSPGGEDGEKTWWFSAEEFEPNGDKYGAALTLEELGAAFVHLFEMANL